MSSSAPGRPFQSLGGKLALGVIALLVVAAVIVAISFATRGSDPTPSPSASSTAGPVSDPDDASTCGLEGFETENSLEAAPVAEWELVGTVAAPLAPEGAGPGRVGADGFRSCYAHTAEGALFAAVSYFAVASDVRLLPRVPDLLEEGLGKDAAIANAADNPSPSSSRLQVAGFKINSYDENEAVVDVAWNVTSEGGALVSFPTVLHWQDGDWKVVVTDDGQFPYAAAALPNLAGYIPWAGV